MHIGGAIFALTLRRRTVTSHEAQIEWLLAVTEPFRTGDKPSQGRTSLHVVDTSWRVFRVLGASQKSVVRSAEQIYSLLP